jgi:hypothetical protein
MGYFSNEYYIATLAITRSSLDKRLFPKVCVHATKSRVKGVVWCHGRHEWYGFMSVHRLIRE